MKRSVRVATCAVAAVAAIGLSSGPASADPAPPNDNGYTYALPDNDIPCFGVSPHGERYMSHRVFMKGHDEFPIAIGKGRIELSADISNSSTPDSFRFPMTPCRSFVTVP